MLPMSSYFADVTSGAALIAEAHAARKFLLTSPEQSIGIIAASHGRCRTRLGKLVALACLAPDNAARASVLTSCVGYIKRISHRWRRQVNRPVQTSLFRLNRSQALRLCEKECGLHAPRIIVRTQPMRNLGARADIHFR